MNFTFAIYAEPKVMEKLFKNYFDFIFYKLFELNKTENRFEIYRNKFLYIFHCVYVNEEFISQFEQFWEGAKKAGCDGKVIENDNVRIIGTGLSIIREGLNLL